jgi:hypothetical protein
MRWRCAKATALIGDVYVIIFQYKLSTAFPAPCSARMPDGSKVTVVPVATPGHCSDHTVFWVRVLPPHAHLVETLT